MHFYLTNTLNPNRPGSSHLAILEAATDELSPSCFGRMPPFKHVVLVGSPQDKFVPLYSAHLHPPADMAKDDPRYQMIETMSRRQVLYAYCGRLL